MLRARLFDYTAQVACLTIAGILTIVLLILGIALNPPTEIFVDLLRFRDSGPLNIRTVWFSGSIAAGAALLVGVGLVVPRKGVTPSGAGSSTSSTAWSCCPWCRCAWRSWRSTARCEASPATEAPAHRLFRGPPTTRSGAVFNWYAV